MLKVEPQTIDDLWYLSKIIDVGNTATVPVVQRFKYRTSTARRQARRKDFRSIAC